MKIMIGVFVFILLFSSAKIFVFAQTDDSKQQIDVASLITAARMNARRASWHYANEYSSSLRKTVETEDGKREIGLYESLCGKTVCVNIMVERNGNALSAKTIRKNREQAAKEIERFDNAKPDKPRINAETATEYAFDFKSNRLEPGLYLKNCETDSSEKTALNGRSSVKIRFKDCSIDNIPPKFKSEHQYMLKIEGWIWLDEADKNIAKVQCFAKKEFVGIAKSDKPLIEINFSRLPEGFWLWSSIRVNTIGNQQIFSDLKGNIQIEMFDYKRFRVDIDEPKIGDLPK